jgi:hypothetical protein
MSAERDTVNIYIKKIKYDDSDDSMTLVTLRLETTQELLESLQESSRRISKKSIFSDSYCQESLESSEGGRNEECRLSKKYWSKLTRIIKLSAPIADKCELDLVNFPVNFL